MENLWHVYILECADGSLYTEIARDVQARIKRHNQARGARFTKGRGPVQLMYCESLADKASALRREIEIKQLSRRNKRRLINHRVVPSLLREELGNSGLAVTS